MNITKTTWPNNTLGVRTNGNNIECLWNNTRQEYIGVDFTKQIGICKCRDKFIELTNDHKPRGLEERYCGPITNSSQDQQLIEACFNCKPITVWKRSSENEAILCGNYIIKRTETADRVTQSGEKVDWKVLVIFIVKID